MKAYTIKTLILCLGLSAIITGCQGQNPIKGSTDLEKEYPNAMKANAPADEARKPLPPEPNNNQAICRDPFEVSIENDAGNLVMLFTEGQTTKYKISVRNTLGDAFSMIASGPQGKQEITSQDNEVDYTFEWTPPKGKFVGKVIALNLNFASERLRLCDGGATAQINLLVYPSVDLPTVTMLGLPKSTLKFGETFKFQVEVNDPATTETTMPKLEVTFSKQSQSGERTVLNASKAALCENTAKWNNGVWVFDCRFDSNLIEGVDKFLNKNRTAQATFYVKAISGRTETKRTSAATPANIKVEFPNTQAQKQGVQP